MGVRKITLEMLVEGPGGNLLFVPVKKTKKEALRIMQEETNALRKHTLEKQLKDRGANQGKTD